MLSGQVRNVTKGLTGDIGVLLHLVVELSVDLNHLLPLWVLALLLPLLLGMGNLSLEPLSHGAANHLRVSEEEEAYSEEEVSLRQLPILHIREVLVNMVHLGDLAGISEEREAYNRVELLHVELGNRVGVKEEETYLFVGRDSEPDDILLLEELLVPFHHLPEEG